MTSLIGGSEVPKWVIAIMGRRSRVPAAHHGIFCRVSAAVTYGAGGGGGVGSAGTRVAAKAGVAGGASADSTGAGSSDGDPSPLPDPVRVWRASFERFNKCSGTSTKAISAKGAVGWLRPGLGGRPAGGRRQDSRGLASFGAPAGCRRSGRQRLIVAPGEGTVHGVGMRTRMVEVAPDTASWTVVPLRAP